MTKEGAVIMECEYFPCWEWFDTFMKAEQPILNTTERFVRSTYRNRAYVAGPNGVICLTVPLQGGRNQRSAINEIRIDYTEDWRALHWKTIVSFYRRSAFFEYYEEAIRAFYNKKYDLLIDVNKASLDLLLQLFQIRKEFIWSIDKKEHLAKRPTNQFLPKNRKLVSQEPYIQTFSDRNGFEPNLSMLDFLFCNGRWG